MFVQLNYGKHLNLAGRREREEERQREREVRKQRDTNRDIENPMS